MTKSSYRTTLPAKTGCLLLKNHPIARPQIIAADTGITVRRNFMTHLQLKRDTGAIADSTKHARGVFLWLPSPGTPGEGLGVRARARALAEEHGISSNNPS